MTAPVASPLPPHWPRVWRGESSGEHFEHFDLDKTRHGVGFFFAQRHDHAASYAGVGTAPRAFVLDPGRCLDLRDPVAAWRDPAARQVLEEVEGRFEDWTCRYSGEPRCLVDYLEAGDLYDYEGTGSAQRWNALFHAANAAGFDSVVVWDNTDGVVGIDAVVWVVFDPSHIHADPSRVAPSLSRAMRP